jgi:GPH family glycoside/pentoside/hexuronide:cation symporter
MADRASPDAATDVPFGRRLSYGAGAFGIAAIYGLLVQLLLFYYTDVYGLDPKLAGLIAFTGALIDGLIDPVVGWITSQTNTRMGRYRPYLVFGTLPVSLTFVLIFSKPGFAQGHLFAFAFVTQLLFRICYQAVFLPYTALLTQISAHAATRSVVAGYKAWFVALGQLFVAWFGLAMVHAFEARYSGRGFLFAAIVVALVSAAAIFQAGLFAREVDTEGEDATRDVANPIAALGHMLRNRYFVMVSLANLIFAIGVAILTSGVIYILRYELGAPDDLRMVLAAMFLAGLVATPFWAAISRRHGKQAAWVGGSLACAVTLAVAAIVHPMQLWSYALVFAIHGAGLQGIYVVMFASMADAVDYGEWRTGGRTEAFSFGCMTFLNKAALAISGGVLGLILSGVGFHANTTQSPATLHALRLMLFLIPAALWLVTAALMAFYTLSNARHDRARRELALRRARIDPISKERSCPPSSSPVPPDLSDRTSA